MRWSNRFLAKVGLPANESCCAAKAQMKCKGGALANREVKVHVSAFAGQRHPSMRQLSPQELNGPTPRIGGVPLGVCPGPRSIEGVFCARIDMHLDRTSVGRYLVVEAMCQIN
jgi:hypothetical protein